MRSTSGKLRSCVEDTASSVLAACPRIAQLFAPILAGEVPPAVLGRESMRSPFVTGCYPFDRLALTAAALVRRPGMNRTVHGVLARA